MSRGIPRESVKKEQTADSVTALAQKEEKKEEKKASIKVTGSTLENPNGTAEKIENETPKDAFDVRKALTMDMINERMKGG